MADGAATYFQPRSPLNAKLDAKSFVQLTMWVLVILLAWAIGSWVFKKLKTKTLEMSGKVSAQGGSNNPFY